MKFTKIITIILWIILAISAVLVVSMIANISDAETDPAMNSWINNNIIWTYVLLAVSAGIAILSEVFHMVSDIRAAKKGLFALGAIVIVGILAYTLASDEIPQFIGVDKFIASGALTPSIAKMVDAGLIATYLLSGIAVLSLIWSSISNVFK
ncbi:hypothetical protein BA6E_121529 [Bacteroidales bacterium 6E]|nr:hypothetical protein BA6E_121529 [Bacteroidales bacterium 6E]